MKVLYLLSMFAFLAGCATTSRNLASEETSQSEWEGEANAPRYLAWLEGGVETGYQTDARRVKRRAEELEKNPPAVTDKENFLEWVSLLDAQGKYKQSGEKIREFIGANPKDGRGAFLLGVHYLRLKKTAMAQYLFEKLEKDATYKWQSLVLNNLGMIALERGDRYAAIDYFERAAKAKPALAAPSINLGSLYLQSQSYKDAERAFSQAHSLDPWLEDAIVGKGVALEGLGQFQQAHLAYAEYLERNPEALAVLYNDAVILGKRLGRTEVAKTQMLRYIEKGGKETARAQELMQSWR